MAVDTASRRAARRSKRTPKSKRGFLRRFWWVFLAVPAAIGAVLLGVLVYVYANLELPEELPPIQTTYLYDRDGRFITTLHGQVDRTIIPFDRMPKSLRNAVVAVEDHNFYEHPGFDPIGILRAAWTDLTAGEVVQGGSTITQQLVKNVYAGEWVTNREGERTYEVPDRTISQKVREVLLAVKVEQELSKGEILGKYLNTIYFGHGAYGVQAASQTYWGKDAQDLSLLESATLAAAIAAPSDFDPIADPSDSYVRRNYVLDRMVEEGYLTAARVAKLKEKPVTTRKGEGIVSYRAPHFVDYLQSFLEESRRFGDTLYSGGYRVTTTIDLDWQRAAERAVAAYLPGAGDPEVALVAIDPRTGGIRAMVGGREAKVRRGFNLAVDASRQAGSAFKTFGLAAAMEERISLDSVWYGPGSYTIRDERCDNPDGTHWKPGNYGDSSAGTMTLLRATAGSVNTIFAQLAVEVGPDAIADVAHRLGIRSELAPFCSIVLGSEGVNPLEMTSAYATLAGRGIYHRPTPVERIRSTDGEVLQRLDSDGRRVLVANDAALVTYALQGVVTSGTGTNAQLPDGRPVAGKTGTAQEYTDAWFCGYTPQLATCVWVGYRDANEPMLGVNGYPAVYGGSIPALVWRDFMAEALADTQIAYFVEPSFEGYDEGPTPPPEPTPSPKPKPTPSPTPSPKPTPTPTPTPTPSETPDAEVPLRRRG